MSRFWPNFLILLRLFFLWQFGAFQAQLLSKPMPKFRKNDPIPRKCPDRRTGRFYFIRPFRLQPGFPQKKVKKVHFFWKPHYRLKEWQAWNSPLSLGVFSPTILIIRSLWVGYRTCVWSWDAILYMFEILIRSYEIDFMVSIWIFCKNLHFLSAFTLSRLFSAPASFQNIQPF